MLKNKLTYWRQRLRIHTEYLVLYSKLPAILKVFLIDLALVLDRGQWFGSLWQLPKFWITQAALVGQRNQVNQLGNSTLVPTNQQSFQQKLESQVIAYLKKQLHARGDISGYCTSGGTEANLFLMWLARSWFEKNRLKKTVVFGTALTHYSVTKAARILQLPFVPVAVTTEYVMSPINLATQLQQQYRRGVRGFALVITWGYSSTGGCDDWQTLEPVIQQFEKTHPGCRFFVWIDAAAEGLPLLHLSPKHTKPFQSRYVQGYLVDYHKLGGAPVGAGIVLYRKTLISLIETPIPYLVEADATLLGSRPGATVLAIWASQQIYNAAFWQRQFSKQLQLKKTWLQQMQQKHPRLHIITHPLTLSLGFVIGAKFGRLSSSTEAEYALYPITIKTLVQDVEKSQVKTFKHYKLHFLKNQPPVW